MLQDLRPHDLMPLNIIPNRVLLNFLKALCLAYGIIYLQSFLQTLSRPRQPPVVCNRKSEWRSIREDVREEVRQKVLKHFPWAAETEYRVPNQHLVVLDNRNEAIAVHGYFVLGFDNYGLHTAVPTGYDYYVKFSSDNIGSHFYLKPTVIRQALQGCETQVKFIYKDADVVLKDHISTGFYTGRITYQEEFHNGTANAGLIMGRKGRNVNSILAKWEAGYGLGENIEQDQTVLRALIAEQASHFTPAPPNSLARHVNSDKRNREFVLWKEQLKKSEFLHAVRCSFLILLFCSTASYLKSALNGKILHTATTQNNFPLLVRLFIRFGPAQTVMTACWLACVEILIRNPIIIARFFGHRVPLERGRYNMSRQILADDLVRLWVDGWCVFVSNAREAYCLRNVLPIREELIVFTLDALFLIVTAVPVYWFFLALSVISFLGIILSLLKISSALVNPDLMYRSTSR